ncbi:MAG: beta-lactamase family protein [Deltaproteobacteria bacterium]|nr:beta-lactamase family protein [Deltaproteobacteria bacterium]MBN2673159.1 beta-lactamase family protein [Deltaproteobacteria bacterium]
MGIAAIHKMNQPTIFKAVFLFGALFGGAVSCTTTDERERAVAEPGEMTFRSAAEFAEQSGEPTLIDFSELDAFLQKYQRLFNRSAILIRKDGRVVYSYGDVQTAAYAASCSKWLSSATIMRLVEQKQLALDVPVGQYMPKLHGRAGEVTLRQLLSHTAGLSAQGGNHDEWQQPPMQTSASRLHFLPSDAHAFCYENAGFNFAGRVAAKRAEKKWSQIFREEIAVPLGLSNSYFRKSKPTAAAGAMISASDYSLFLEMIRQNGVSPDGIRVLTESSVREILKNHTAGLEMTCIPRPSARKESHGLGVWRQGGSRERPDLASHFGAGGYKVFLDYCRNVSAVFAMEYKRGKEDRAKNVTRNMYSIVQRAIPVTPSCAVSNESVPDRWRPPLRRPSRQEQ